jgi:hypothetical protein
MAGEAYLTARDLARREGITVKAVRKRTLDGEGPLTINRGRPRYRLTDVIDWEKSRAVTCRPGGEEAAGGK